MPARGLKKELGLLDVIAVATGATLSSGFFLLPGLAAAMGGGTIPLAYFAAGICLVPGLLSKVELSTAMPRAGGIYYSLDRSMGPLVGTVGGFGTWATLVLKSALALVGLGAYLQLYFPNAPSGPIALSFALAFGALNLFGVKKVGSFQRVLTVILLAVLGWFIGQGITRVSLATFGDVFDTAAGSFVGAMGLVIVSYLGLTKVVSISEEVKDPDRNIPLGLGLAFVMVLAIYCLGTWIMISVAGVDALAANGGDLTPAATAAEALAGSPGAAVMTVAAVLAFWSAANAGILAASRYPYAMSRDHVLPRVFRRLSPWRTPHVAILFTVAFTVLVLLLFDPTHLAELAGAFLLLTFALSCLAVVVMRESRIHSYDPGFRSPFYPWIQIVGILLPFPIIVEMGWLATLLSGGFITTGIIWYTYYARDRVTREGAIYHVFERLGRQRDSGLERELREILKEKGLRAADPFEELVTRSPVIDVAERVPFRDVADRVSEAMSARYGIPEAELSEGFVESVESGVMPAAHGAILPHLRHAALLEPTLCLVRAAVPIDLGLVVGVLEGDPVKPIHAAFFLAGPEAEPGLHLRLLAQIAARVDGETFLEEWLEAGDEQELREVMLRDERMWVLDVRHDHASGALIGNAIRDLALPETTLVAMIRRDADFVVPHGSTRIEEGDRLTILGEPHGIIDLRHRYGDREGGPA